MGKGKLSRVWRNDKALGKMARGSDRNGKADCAVSMLEGAAGNPISMRTESEEKFEQYLTGQNLIWTRIPESNRKEPDYTVRHRDANCVFEVKEFGEPETLPFGGYDPLPPIRHKIKRAAEKFTDYRNYCCGIVLWGSRSIHRTADQSVVFPAAFGQCLNTQPDVFIDAGPEPRSFHLSGKAALTQTQNTTVSAVAILTEYELNHVWLEAWREIEAKQQRGEEIYPLEQAQICQQISGQRGPRNTYKGTIRMIVLENPYAKKPFPPDLFVGPFDQHWRLQSGWFRLAFMGSEIERLKNDNVPSVFW